MRNRSFWQILAVSFVLAALQRYFRDPSSFFSMDALLLVPAWLILLAILCFTVFTLERLGKRARSCVRVLVSDDGGRPASEKNWAWVLGGIVFLGLVLIRLEQKRSFFFTEDDNLMQFLPVMLQGGRSLLHGTFPTWNPYQFLGAPTTSMGVYALTYPITYLAYFLSRFVFHNEFLTIEVYCTLHIFGGYLAFYWAARSYSVRAPIAMIASLCTVLSGWMLIATPSWFYVSPIFVYVPLLVVAIAKLQYCPTGWKWICGTALTIGLFFHSGNVQFWVYGMMFLAIALVILKWSALIDWRKLSMATAAILLGVALVCPLLIPMFLQTRDSIRVMPQNTGQITGEWQAALLPAPWVHAPDPADSLEPAWKTGGLILYSGTTFVLVFVLLLGCFVFYRLDRKLLGENTWSICAVFAWLAAMGRAGIVWPILMHLPMLSKFRIALKFVAFFDVFAVLAGAIVLERILRRVHFHKPFTTGVVVVTAALLFLSCMMPLPTWYTYPIKPYPAANFILEQIPDARNQSQRVMSLGLTRSPAPNYWQEMPHNLPTVYQIPAVTGYDPLVGFSATFHKVEERFKTHLLQSLQEYGAEYVLLPNDFNDPRLSGNGLYAPMEKYPPVPRSEVPKLLAESKVLFHNEGLSVVRVPDVKPLGFAESTPNTSFPVKLLPNGFDMELSSWAGGRVIANFLWYPEIRAQVDGRAIQTKADSWQRIAMDVPAAAKRIQVRFVPEWGKGVLCAVLVGLAGIACALVGLRANWAAAGARTASP